MAMDSPVEGVDYLRDAMEKTPAFFPMDLQDDDWAEILYTSSTTGNPKGCVHSHKSVVCAGVTGAKALGLDMADAMLIAMPIWHSSPLNNWFMGITTVAGKSVLLREYHPLHFLQAIQKRKCTAYFGAPISYLMPLQMIPNFGEFDLSSMKAWVYGGGPIAPETVKKLKQSYRSDRFYQVYGMTESGPTGTVLVPEDHENHAGSIGKQALPGARMKVMKDETTQAGPGETGEIWLKADSMMKGYLNNPEATAAAFYDGWYRTGDMARIDAEGFLFIVDRKKDMIITGGENVYSKEVEDRLMEHPGIAQSAVIGCPHPDWGETVHAVVVPGKDQALTEDDLKRFLSERLAKYKIPRKFHFPKEFLQEAGRRNLMGCRYPGKWGGRDMDWVSTYCRRGRRRLLPGVCPHKSQRRTSQVHFLLHRGPKRRGKKRISVWTDGLPRRRRRPDGQGCKSAEGKPFGRTQPGG